MSNIEHINEFDTLNAGRNKINKFAIDPANRAELNSINAKSIANQANQTSQSAEAIAINTDDRLDNIIAGEMQDAEVIDARRPSGGDAYATLGERLDSDKAEVNAQLAQRPTQSYVDSLMSNITDGSPKELFYYLDALTTKYPSGTTGPMLVMDSSFVDGAHSFIWDGTSWVDTGVYQAQGIAEKSIESFHIKDIPSAIVDMNNVRGSNINYFNPKTATIGKYLHESGSIMDSAALAISDYIPVSEGDIITISKSMVQPGGVFGNSGAWIASIPRPSQSSSNPWTFTVPKGGAYIRTNMDKNGLNSWMVVPGNELPTEYISYGMVLPWLKTSSSTPLSNEKWKNKRLIALGDSITWQDGKVYGTGQQAGQIAKGYLTILEDAVGLASVENTAVSGASMTNDGSANTPVTVKGKQYNYNDYDLVTILAGTNDWGKQHALGDILPIGSAFDDTTITGAYQSLLEYIINSNNQVRIYMMTPLKRKDEGISNYYPLTDIVNRIKEIGALYSVPVLDLYNNSMFNKLNFATYTKANDGVHPIDIGYERLSELTTPFIQTH